MRALVILDRQHGDKGDRFDPGAVASGRREVDLSAAYGRAAADALRALGVDVLWIDAGSYQSRHLEAIDASSCVDAPALYCALHVNAGGGRYGAVFHDARSARGARAAMLIASSLGVALPELSVSRHISARADDWTSNAWHTMRRIYSGPPSLSGVCIEPGFIDSAEHVDLWYESGLKRIGDALAEGIVDFLRHELRGGRQ